MACRDSAAALTKHKECVRTLGGTPNKDPCGLSGLIWGLPWDIGVI